MSAPSVLIVEDDADLAAEMMFNLKHEGIAVDWVCDATAMNRKLDEARFDLVVLDLGLPGEDGISIARRLSSREDLRLIMVTARASREERITGYDAGADVYMTKPVDMRELASAIRRLARRVRGQAPSWRLDLRTARLQTPDGRRIDLTPLESALLRELQRSPDQIAHRHDLETALWGSSDPSTNRRLEVSVNRLRDKIAAASGGGENPLKTERLRGYRFTAPLESGG